MPALIVARLLGAPQLTIDGAPPPAELLWRKHLALCIALWSAPEGRRSRDQLIGLLWSDKSDRAARHSLNEALRVIRRSAGADVVDTSGDSVCWMPLPDLDITRFRALESSDPVAAARLVAGPFCDGFDVPNALEFDTWLSGERVRWQAASIGVLLRAAAMAEDAGDARGALDFAEHALALNATSDLAVQAVIRAHWLRGDRAAALAAGELYRDTLVRELDCPVDDRTAALLARVARERHPIRPRGGEEQQVRSPLIGREELLGALIAQWRAEPAARARVLVVTGATGSGRSRVLEEMVSRAVLSGATVAMMRAVEADRSDADAAVLGLARAGLDAAPGVAGAPPAALAAFGARLPEWAERFRTSAASDVQPLRQAFGAAIDAASEERPVLLAIDDADRLHHDELRWLAALLRELGSRRVTLLLSTTAGTSNAAMDELMQRTSRDIPGAVVRVEPLTQQQLRLLVAWAVPSWTAEAQDRLARRLVLESAGLPAFAVDIIRAVQQGLTLDSAWPAPDRTFDATLPGPLPEPLVAAVRVAFRLLSPDAQALLAAAALLAEPFGASDAGRAAGIDDIARRDTALDTLEWEQWIVADARGYSFPARAKRRLIAAEMMTPGQRRRLEERISTSG